MINMYTPKLYLGSEVLGAYIFIIGTVHTTMENHQNTGTLVHCGWNCKLLRPLWKTASSFLKKLKGNLAIWDNMRGPRGHHAT